MPSNTMKALSISEAGQSLTFHLLVFFLCCVRLYRAIQITSPVDVMNRAVFQVSGRSPQLGVEVCSHWPGLVGQSCMMCAMARSGWAVLHDVCHGQVWLGSPA